MGGGQHFNTFDTSKYPPLSVLSYPHSQYTLKTCKVPLVIFLTSEDPLELLSHRSTKGHLLPSLENLPTFFDNFSSKYCSLSVLVHIGIWRDSPPSERGDTSKVKNFPYDPSTLFSHQLVWKRNMDYPSTSHYPLKGTLRLSPLSWTHPLDHQKTLLQNWKFHGVFYPLVGPLHRDPQGTPLK